MLIAQITDTHLKLPGKLAYKRVDTAQMLRDCVAELLKLDPQPDLIVHTGDLTDFGLPEEYANLKVDPGAAAGADPRHPRQSRRARGNARRLSPRTAICRRTASCSTRSSADRCVSSASIRWFLARAVASCARSGLRWLDSTLSQKPDIADGGPDAPSALPHRASPIWTGIGLVGRDGFAVGNAAACAG